MSLSSQKIEKGRHAFTMIIRDITFQKGAEKQLADKANMLETINRELEEFVYIISHDLKEPLFAIDGYTSRLYRTYKDVYDDKGKLFTDRIKINVQTMSNKIKEIMEVLKIGRIVYKFGDNDSGAIVKDVVNSLETRIKTNRIKVTIDHNLPTVYCDERRLKDLFSNLVTNAIKFMGTSEQTETSHDRSAEERDDELRSVKIGCQADTDAYKFFVEDTGIGIRKEYQEQIFKIFRRLRDIETEGTGVGLAIVKKIVELHSGKLWIESPVEDGRGSRFCFTIPKTSHVSNN
jgi:light-regulated signal transduction histidine kinase (bacteriophytochrome)